MAKNIIYCNICSQMDYKESLVKQEKIFDKIISIKRLNKNKNYDLNLVTLNHIICTSHPNVYTIGKSTDLKEKLKLKNSSIPVFEINRGGKITFHGPGQAVVYFIFDLENLEQNIISFLRKIEIIIVKTLNEYTIKAFTVSGKTGVWTNLNNMSQKICSIGIRSKFGVTMHGLALNVNNDLGYFDSINPCGMDNVKITSMKEILRKKIKIDDLFKKIGYFVSQEFNCSIKFFNCNNFIF